MKNKLLDLLKSTNDYLSGEEIGEALGVSRASVWKYINALRKEGYEIEAVTNRGYKINNTFQVLNEREISKSLNTWEFGKELYVIETVDSTNNKVRELAQNGAKEGCTVIAETQTGGKGRLGRPWKSPPGNGVWISVLLKPEIAPQNVSSITLLAGLSVCKVLRALFGVNAEIKWPNDVLLNGKKLCGILTEMNAQMESVDFVIVGIGINVNNASFPKDIEDVATSIYQNIGKEVNRIPIICELLKELEKNYAIYKQKGFSGIRAEYSNLCVTLNKEVKVIAKDGFIGKAVEITDEGELVVEKSDKTRVTVFSGEVSIRPVKEN
ncbi:MAG: biotin--[acetyl-CoA-carboxylase] ligase [Anaerotignaceae bacterium]